MVFPEVKEVERSPALFESLPDDREVQWAGRQKDETLVLLAHELRSPLAAIRNAMQVLQEGGGNATTREWVHGVLDRQTRQVSCLIEELLEFSRLSRGQAQLRKRSVNLAQVVDWAIETVRPCIDERCHVLKVVLPPGPVTLEADPTLLEQVLTNLLGNAAKYTDPGGRIWLTAESVGDDIVLRVRDTGVGIVPEALSHVFDLFWQSPAAAGHSQGGLGIGLALVRLIVQMHGGDISALSTGPGKGSEFVVHLPRTNPPENRPGNLNGTPMTEE